MERASFRQLGEGRSTWIVLHGAGVTGEGGQIGQEGGEAVQGEAAVLRDAGDNFSRKILSWRIADRIEAMATVSMLQEAIARSHTTSKPQTTLVDGGTENFNMGVDKLVDEGLVKRVLAQTEIHFSNSMIEAFWSSLKHQWLFLNPLDSIASVEKLVAFFVEQHNTVLPHSAFAGQTPDEMYTGAGVNVPDELHAARETARLERIKVNKALTCEACEHWTAGKQPEEPAA